MAPRHSNSLMGLLKNWVTDNVFYSYLNSTTIGVQLSLRRRCTIAELNAGVTLLVALPGFKYRIIDAAMIAIGGAVTSATTVDITGTLTTSRKLLAVAIAALTQSAKVNAGAANATILADGASFTANDVNTAILGSVTGSAITVATAVDVFIEYVIEKV